MFQQLILMLGSNIQEESFSRPQDRTSQKLKNESRRASRSFRKPKNDNRRARVWLLLLLLRWRLRR
jgi:hypothetical protein